MRATHLRWLLSLALGLTAADSLATPLQDAKAQPDDAAEAKTIRVPFTLLPSRHMLIEVKINDQGPYNLIFDTGAPLNLINGRVGKEAGLTKRSGGFGIFLGGLNQVEVKSLRIGDAKAEKLPAIVMDHPTVRSISDAFESDFGKIEGIIGFPFFARYAMTVDYQAKVLILKPNGYVPGDYLQDLSRNLNAAADAAGKPKLVSGLGVWGFAPTKPKEDTDAGVDIESVLAGSPAAKAGLKTGDRLLTLDDRWTDSPSDAYLAASLVKPGRTVTMKIRRGDKILTLQVTPKLGL